ncbi:MAG: class II fumarate hydratase [Gammaproteobacteria bacterium]|nr:class II fumarate hydratase [Gammaproteobacteria bacterium]
MTDPSPGPAAQPEDILYGEQTRLALDNFRISALTLPPAFIHALGLIKAAAARANGRLGELPADMAEAIALAADEVAVGHHDGQFGVDVFQTGSGTSTHMNANEVIATLAARRLGREAHPNDHVNRGQSSNDVIPSAIHVSAARGLQKLKDALATLAATLEGLAQQYHGVVKTGRTHLMDAAPLTLGQEISGWAAQVRNDHARLADVEPRLLQLAVGGTAVGTGLNAHPRLALETTAELARCTGLEFRPAANAFAAISSQDTAIELSGQLRVTAATLAKIAGDLRWMNSGPVAGLGEIRLKALQPGSSIMPGKVNPVIPEAVSMVCAQVVGCDAAIAASAWDNRFQLATMLPLVAYNLNLEIALLTGAARALDERALRDMEVDVDSLRRHVERNAMLATALTPRIGYERAGAIARRAVDEGRTVLEVALEETDIPGEELKRLLDPVGMV